MTSGFTSWSYDMKLQETLYIDILYDMPSLRNVIVLSWIMCEVVVLFWCALSKEVTKGLLGLRHQDF
jgi:hypothetical protein